MAITVEAVYEGGVLKPAQPLPLREHETVRITIDTATNPLAGAYGMIGWKGDHETLERILAEAEESP